MKALIVEDEYLARDELKWLIESHSSIEVVATAADCEPGKISITAEAATQRPVLPKAP